MARRSKRNPVVNFVKSVASHKKNKIVDTLLTYVAPAVGSYVAIHTVGRMAHHFVAKRWPAYANHASFGVKLAAAATVYYVSDKVKFMKERREAILAGMGVALVESLVRLMLPGMAWAIDGPAPASRIAPHSGPDDLEGDDDLLAPTNDDELNDEDLGGLGGGLVDVN